MVVVVGTNLFVQRLVDFVSPSYSSLCVISPFVQLLVTFWRHITQFVDHLFAEMGFLEGIGFLACYPVVQIPITVGGMSILDGLDSVYPSLSSASCTHSIFHYISIVYACESDFLCVYVYSLFLCLFLYIPCWGSASPVKDPFGARITSERPQLGQCLTSFVLDMCSARHV